MKRSLLITFWALIASFLFILSEFFIPTVRDFVRGSELFLFPFLIFFLLGISLTILTLKEKVEGALKCFFLLMGVSAAGCFASIILHNLIYGFFIYWFGPEFWENINMRDELFFFFFAVVVCPIGFLVGLIGSIALLVKGRKRNQ